MLVVEAVAELKMIKLNAQNACESGSDVGVREVTFGYAGDVEVYVYV